MDIDDSIMDIHNCIMGTCMVGNQFWKNICYQLLINSNGDAMFFYVHEYWTWPSNMSDSVAGIAICGA